MKQHFTRALGASAAMVLAFTTPAAAQAQYEPLRLNGELVRWFPKSDGRFVLYYAIINSDHYTVTSNCGHIRAPDQVRAAAGISTEEFRALTRRAFAAWHDASGITFLESRSDSADIVIGEQGAPAGFAFTSVEPGARRQSGWREIERATICFNPQKRWKAVKDGNADIYDLTHTLTHEIGHAIGLDHPGRRGHIMSFRYDEDLRGLTSGDIAGARFLYGIGGRVGQRTGAGSPAGGATAREISRAVD